MHAKSHHLKIKCPLRQMAVSYSDLPEETALPRNTPLPDVELTEDEQEYLFAIIHKGTNSARVITRARILCKLVKGYSSQEACSALDVTQPTVVKIRQRLAEGGLQAALSELPRPGQAPKLDAKQTAMITATSLLKGTRWA